MPSPSSSPSSDAERPHRRATAHARDRTDRIRGGACGGRPNLQPAATPGAAAVAVAAAFDHGALAPVRRPMLDLICATIQGTGGLLERLAAITDPRAKRGVRHRLVAPPAIAAGPATVRARGRVCVW